MKYILLIFLLAAACKNKSGQLSEYEKNGFKKATLINPGIAGCDYILKVDSVNYQPLNLTGEFRKDSAVVWVKFHKEKNMMTNCMMGEVITIDEIRKDW